MGSWRIGEDILRSSGRNKHYSTAAPWKTPELCAGRKRGRSGSPFGKPWKREPWLWLGLEWHEQGLMSEACDVVNAYWFDVLGFPVLRAPKASPNTASRRISQRQGIWSEKFCRDKLNSVTPLRFFRSNRPVIPLLRRDRVSPVWGETRSAFQGGRMG